MSRSTIADAVKAALLAFRDEECDRDLEDLLAPVVAGHGWPPVGEALLGILEADEPGLWPDAAGALWATALDRCELDSNRVIALVYHRLGGSASDHDSNLAWSVASRLKGVGYLSDYDPLADPDVLRELERLTLRDQSLKARIR